MVAPIATAKRGIAFEPSPAGALRLQARDSQRLHKLVKGKGAGESEDFTLPYRRAPLRTVQKESPNIELRMIGGGYGYELSRRSMVNWFVLERSGLWASQEV